MNPFRPQQPEEEKPPSYDRHLADSTPFASSSAEPPELWRPRAASDDAAAASSGPSEAFYRAASASALAPAPTTDVTEKPSTAAQGDDTADGVADVDPGPRELPPPEYTRQDPNDQVFVLNPPMIACAPTDAGPLVPRFQLAQLRTSNNKPYKLRLRRFTTTECRRLAHPGRRGPSALVEFDDDLTMYLIANTHALFPWSSPEIEIRGCKARTLPGVVELRRTVAAYQFWHVTRNDANDMLRPENRRRLEKYGYHADDEISRALLYAAEPLSLLSRDQRWRDGDGVCVATETGGALRLAVDLDAQGKDALLACWVARCWLLGTLNW